MDILIKSGSKVDSNIILKYKNIMPNEIINLWENYGYCSLLNDYLRMINPDYYLELLKRTYYNGNNAIPVLLPTNNSGDNTIIE